MKTYMLIHGAWHGAWSYDQTRALLEHTGARVITFDLPGHGEDRTEIARVTMQAYVDRVKQELSKVTAPVVLVGHSLAGFIVSQAAEELPDKVEKLIFVAAMVPYGGKSIFDEVSEDPGSELLKNLIFAEDKSWATVNEETLKTVVYNGATALQIQAAAPKLVRQATQPFFVPVTTTDEAFGRIEKAYIVCEKDKILSADAQRRLIEKIRCTRSLSLQTGHVPHVEDPAALANAISTLSGDLIMNAYLSITLKVENQNRKAAAGVYTKYKQPFLDSIKGARSKELLIRDEDVVVLHGFDSPASAQAYLQSDLFTRDVVTGLRPYLAGAPDIRIYSVA